MFGWFAAIGCSIPLQPCEASSECMEAFGEGWTCGMAGMCIAPPPDSESMMETGRPMDSGNDPDDTGTKPEPAPFIINEVLYDPPNTKGEPPPGDANGDGKYVHDDDEFVELINVSAERVDVSGYMLYDQQAWDLGQPRHRIKTGTFLDPGGALVVFGGGAPTGKFGDAEVQVATGGRLNLNNANDTLLIANPQGQIVLSFEITPRSDNPNESYTRNPDIVGPFEQHAASTPLLFSPGTRVDGSPFL
ncbi:MAG: lamin tail domain-containing protein [Myxococcota bacterium]